MSTSSNDQGNNSREEPSVRMKKLIAMSHDVDVDRNVSISRYFNSGRELVKAAKGFEEKGDIEKAFVLYLRYVTLFLEKIIHHPEYAKADKAEKAHVRKECNSVFDLAEGLKKQILEKYTNEYEQSSSHAIEPSQSVPRQSDIDDIDKRFNFSSKPTDGQESVFDPFELEKFQKGI